MRYCTWRRLARVLYRCCFGTSGVSTDFWCAVGGIGLVSSRIMCGTRWGGRLGARPGWNDIYPCGSNLICGTGDASGVVSGVCTIVGGVTCVGGEPW